MRFAGQGYVAQPTGDWRDGWLDETPRWHNPRTGKLEPINPPDLGHGEMRDWGGNPISTEPVGGWHKTMKPIGTNHPLDQPAGLDPYQGMKNVEVAGGFNLYNPFDWRKTGEVRDRIQSGDPNLKFEEGALGTYGKRIRDQQEFLRQHGML